MLRSARVFDMWKRFMTTQQVEEPPAPKKMRARGKPLAELDCDARGEPVIPHPDTEVDGLAQYEHRKHLIRTLVTLWLGK